MKRLLSKIGVVYGMFILIAANFITTSFIISLINYNNEIDKKLQDKALSLANDTAKLLQEQGGVITALSYQTAITGKISEANGDLLNATGHALSSQQARASENFKRLGDSLRNTNNQTTQQFFQIAKNNGKLLKENVDLLTRLIAQGTNKSKENNALLHELLNRTSPRLAN